MGISPGVPTVPYSDLEICEHHPYIVPVALALSPTGVTSDTHFPLGQSMAILDNPRSQST